MDTPNTEPTLGRDRSLGDVLRDARQAKSLELSDIAEITHVRKEYLKALEADDYNALPEDIYAKNFVKLFAQTVGLQEGRVLDLYARARGRAPAQSANVETTVPEPERSDRVRPAGASRPPIRIGAWLPTILFIGLIVALALWGFSNFSSRSTRLANPQPAAAEDTAETTPEPEEAELTVGVAPETPAEGATPLETAAEDDPRSGLFLLSITSNPPGAEVSVDGFPLPGTTPLSYELSPGVSRTLQLTLPNYEPHEEKIDVNSDLDLSVTLTPVVQEPATTTPDDVTPEASADDIAEETAPTEEAANSGLSVSITEPTWLEAYQSTQRGAGERLVYTTVQPGQTFAFTLPVFLHVGNAGGVDLTLEGQALGAMGSSGEVISRAYTP